MTRNANITLDGVDFKVEYYYTPEEPMVMYYSDGSGYPGAAEEFEIYSITHKGTDFTDLLADRFEDIEEIIRESRNDEN